MSAGLSSVLNGVLVCGRLFEVGFVVMGAY